MLLAWLWAAVAGPMINVALSRSAAFDSSDDTDWATPLYVALLALALVTSVLCLWWGLYVIARRFLGFAETIVFSTSCTLVHVVVFLFTNAVL